MPEPKPSSPSLLPAALIGLVIFAGLYFLIVALNTGDLLWLSPVFEEVPVGMVVHCYGEDKEINPGDPAFQPVNEAVNQTLTGFKRWDDLTMSEATYQEYQTNATFMVLELFYDPPARIHSSYKFYKFVDTLIIPLDGRHAQYNSIFGRRGEYTNAGSFHVGSMELIVTVLAEQDICSVP